MKKSAIKIMFMAAVLTFVWGCSSDDESTSANYTFATAEKPAWSVDLTGNDDAPAWTAPDPSLFESAMFIMVKLQDELAAYSTDGDLMAVFIGDECRTVPAIRNVDKNGGIYFVLKIRGNSTDRDVTFSLKYYSVQLHRMFTLEGTEKFAAERTYGFDEDFVPPLLLGCKKYPVQQTLTAELPSTTPFIPGESDIVAVFAGSECRGVGVAGQPFTVFRTTDGETLDVRYYSANQAGVYTLKQKVGQEATIVLNF